MICNKNGLNVYGYMDIYAMCILVILIENITRYFLSTPTMSNSSIYQEKARNGKMFVQVRQPNIHK